MANIDPTEPPADLIAQVWSSIIRTAVPLLVAALVTWLAGIGFPHPSDLTDALSTLIGAAFAALYYTIVRLWEAQHGKASPLLGSRALPVRYRKR